jgi:hypothetical protein
VTTLRESPLEDHLCYFGYSRQAISLSKNYRLYGRRE